MEASLREADRRKNVFLATLSHELRNPLAPIRTAASLLESPRVTAEVLERCRAIISRHGGRIEARSTGRDQGSTFTVQLPRWVVVEAALTTGLAAENRLKESGSRCVLIADDNRDDAESLSMLLRISGHEVHVAHDGPAAFEVAARLKPDVAARYRNARAQRLRSRNAHSG